MWCRYSGGREDGRVVRLSAEQNVKSEGGLRVRAERRADKGDGPLQGRQNELFFDLSSLEHPSQTSKPNEALPDHDIKVLVPVYSYRVIIYPSYRPTIRSAFLFLSSSSARSDRQKERTTDRKSESERRLTFTSTQISFYHESPLDVLETDDGSMSSRVKRVERLVGDSQDRSSLSRIDPTGTDVGCTCE
jgi:hypothetical protein